MKQTAFERLLPKLQHLTKEQSLEVFEKHLGLSTTDILTSLIESHERAIMREVGSTSPYKAPERTLKLWGSLILKLSEARSLFGGGS